MARIVVIQGATGVGKSAVAAELAAHYGAVVISADSRQFYSEMAIGTAVPSTEEQALAHHYFIQDRSVTEPLSAGGFQCEASALIEKLSDGQPSDKIVAIVVGGSGLFVDALLYGLDEIPSDEKVRIELNELYEKEGLEPLLSELKELDPESYNIVERENPQRVVRALEVCKVAGVPYSSLKTGKGEILFDATKIIIDLPREELYDRINCRVDIMIEEGLEAEARSVEKYSHLSALRTVGYSEFFDYFDGKISREKAIDLIKQHSRNYAKRQITWLRRDESTPRFSPFNIEDIIDFIK